MPTLPPLSQEQETYLQEHFYDTLRIQHKKNISIWPDAFIEKYDLAQDFAEKELKILAVDSGYVLQQLHKQGATLLFHGTIEDTRYDFPPGEGIRIQETVRIRKKNDSFYLTIKKKNKKKDIKERDEFEVSIQNPDAFITAFQQLGIVPSHRKKKVRYSYCIEDAFFDLDMYEGIPPLLEIEGKSKDHIRSRIASLGLESHKVVNRSARETLLFYKKW